MYSHVGKTTSKTRLFAHKQALHQVRVEAFLNSIKDNFCQSKEKSIGRELSF